MMLVRRLATGDDSGTCLSLDLELVILGGGEGQDVTTGLPSCPLTGNIDPGYSPKGRC